MPKDYNPKDRKKMEEDEGGLEKTNLPGDRMQSEIQTPKTEETTTPPPSGSTSPGITPKEATKVIGEKMSVKPSSDVKLEEKGVVGGVPLDTGTAVRISAAGPSSTSVLSDESRIPGTEGNYQARTRYAKKNVMTDFMIDNAICETPEPQFRGTEDLRKSGDKLQGYNGVKQFTTARGKKNTGDTPQNTLYDRSLDYVEFDATVHTTGQVISPVNKVSGYPTKAYDVETNSMVDISKPMSKSNYLLKAFRIHFSYNNEIKQWEISGFSFNEDELVATAPNHIQDQANLNQVIDANNVAKSMIRMQKRLGRETTEQWSPIPYVIEQGYMYNMLVHDMEASTGAMVLTAYRCSTTAQSFTFSNVLGKDGAKPVTPIMEAMIGGFSKLSRSIKATDNIAKGGLNRTVFNKDMYRKGSAAALIRMFDSVNKYTTKANFTNMQKSFKMFIQKADNNINPLRAKKEFLMALDTAHVFSTRDGKYNPMLPVYATDKISLVNPMSLDYFCQNWSRNNVDDDNPSGTISPYAYGYNELRNFYDWNIRHPFVDGLIAWCIEHEQKIITTFASDDPDVIKTGVDVVEIPAFFSCLHPSLFQLMVCAASQKILLARNIDFRDFLFADEQLDEDIWDDLTSLKDLNPKFSSNFTVKDASTGIDIGKLKPASEIQLFWGSHFDVISNETPTVGSNYITYHFPWYFNERQFKNTVEYGDFGFFSENEHAYSMSYPELRIGVEHVAIDVLWSMTERDVRLSLDRLVDVPRNAIASKQSYYSVDEKYANNKYEFEAADDTASNLAITALRYDSNSDGRIIGTYKGSHYLNKAAILCTPLELGYLYTKFLNQPIYDTGAITYSNDHWIFEELGNYKVHDIVDGSNGYALKAYSALGSNVDKLSISRTAALKQDFTCFFADRTTKVLAINKKFVTDTGMVPTLGGMFEMASNKNGCRINDFAWYSNNLYQIGAVKPTTDRPSGVPGLMSFARYRWFMLNRLMLPINYFNSALHANQNDKNKSGGSSLLDPFESCFEFGLTGFFASDFSQDIGSRDELYEMSPIDYVKDAFIEASPIFRAD